MQDLCTTRGVREEGREREKERENAAGIFRFSGFTLRARRLVSLFLSFLYAAFPALCNTPSSFTSGLDLRGGCIDAILVYLARNRRRRKLFFFPLGVYCYLRESNASGDMKF